MVHAFVASRVDYCVGLPSGAKKDDRQAVEHLTFHISAARVISNWWKYNRGPIQFQDHTLYWLNVANWIQFILCAQVYKCQHNITPRYLAELCRPVSNIKGQRFLRSAGRGLHYIPRVGLSTYGGHALCYAGPSHWNALTDLLKNKTLSLSTFICQLKHLYFSFY